MRFIALSPEVAGGGGHAGRKSGEVAGVGDEVLDRTVDFANRNGGVAGASAAVASWCGQCGEEALHDEAVAIGQHCLCAHRTVARYRSHSCPQKTQTTQRKQEHIEPRPLSMARVPLTCSSLRP